jgi:hypothetical protein
MSQPSFWAKRITLATLISVDGDTSPGGDEPLYSLTVTTTNISTSCP